MLVFLLVFFVYQSEPLSVYLLNLVPPLFHLILELDCPLDLNSNLISYYTQHNASEFALPELSFFLSPILGENTIVE